MKNYLFKYTKENYKTIKTLVFCLVIGMIMGIIVFNIIDNSIKNELIHNVKTTLDIAKNKNFEGINIIKNGIISNALICFFNLLKGISIGIYISTLFSIFGTGNGLLALILIVLLPNLIYIPSYIYVCTNAINFHYSVLFECS